MDTLFELQQGMIDSHFHLFHIKNKGLDGESLLREAFTRGLSSGMEIGIAPETFDDRKRVIETFPELYMASGLYPSHCEKENWKKDLPVLESHLKGAPRAAALGEIGLDYYHDYGTRALQKELFLSQLDLANSLGLPVVIHSRNAEEETLACLKELPPAAGGIMHCFSSGPDWVLPFLDLGLFISFAGNVTYKKSTILREAAKLVPADRLLVETDAPYLSPQPVRGKVNHPGFIGHTYRILAETRGVDLEDLIPEIRSNFKTFTDISRK